ncbi:MAG: Eco57I restriction-modification methylase domain-containing protein, partial [Nocardioidaceae bacterium]
LSSFALDYIARQKLGGTTLNFFYFEQFPIPAPQEFDKPCPWDVKESMQDRFERRLVELVHTASDTGPLAAAFGDDGPPFHWDPDRRARLRAELDAAVFLLYGYERDDVDYILGTFPIVARHDLDRHGEERTRRLILDAYDGMVAAGETGRYLSPLSPPPGEGARQA